MICFASGSFDQLHDFFGIAFFAGKVINDYICAFTRKRNRRSPTDSRIPTGDECLAVGETPASAVGLFAVIGLGLHLPVRTRDALRLMFELWQRILLRWVLQSV